MRLNRSVLVCTMALFVGCASLGNSDRNSQVVIDATKERPDLRLVLIDQSNVSLESRQTLPLPSENAENEVWKECGLTEKPVDEALEPVGALIAAAGWILKPAIKYVVRKIDDALQKRLNGYTAAFLSSVHGQIYERAAAKPPVLQTRCLRITRRTKTNGDEVLSFDMISQLSIHHGEVLKVRPLRLLYRRAETLSSKDHIGVAFSLEADATWREENVGQTRQDVLVVKNLLSEKIPKHGSFYKTYLDRKWDEYPPHPLIPWSKYSGRHGGGYATFTISVAEVGDPPWLLANSAKLFHDKKDKIVDLLVEAAEGALKDSSGTNNSGSGD